MKRTLRPDELRLWAKVARTAEPVSGRTPPSAPRPMPAPEPPPASSPPAVRPAVDLSALQGYRDRSAAGVRAPRATAPHTPPALALDPRRRRRLARERDPIEARLDLHGLDHDAARAALERFVLGAHLNGARAVLVITGKGLGGAGLLRQLAPEWLRAPPLRSLVAGVAEADRRHGGGGALYVALKRKG